MDKIKLSKNAKKVLLALHNGLEHCPYNMDSSVFADGADELEVYHLIQTMRQEGGGIVDARLTHKGRSYMAANPTLSNPTDWKWIIATLLSSIAVLVSIIALFIACTE